MRKTILSFLLLLLLSGCSTQSNSTLHPKFWMVIRGGYYFSDVSVIYDTPTQLFVEVNSIQHAEDYLSKFKHLMEKTYSRKNYRIHAKVYNDTGILMKEYKEQNIKPWTYSKTPD